MRASARWLPAAFTAARNASRIVSSSDCEVSFVVANGALIGAGMAPASFVLMSASSGGVSILRIVSVTIAVHPSELRQPVVIALEDEPAMLDSSALRLLAAGDVGRGRHRRPRRQHPDVSERCGREPWPRRDDP